MTFLGLGDGRAQARRRLAERMGDYYRSAATYHDVIGEIAEERPSAEERPVLAAIAELSGAASAARPTGAVLEIGCGTCGLADALLKAAGASTYYGVDASPFAIEQAARAHPSYRLTVADAAALPFADGSFDVVLSAYVVEHMVYPERMLAEAVRVTRPGGLIALIVPVCDLPWALPSSLRHRKHAAPFVLGYTARRWAEALRVRYDAGYFAFMHVDDPIVLQRGPGYAFAPDDDQVYIGSTQELKKYLASQGCEVTWQASRDISSFIANGRRPWVDLARRAVFLGYRASLGRLDRSEYTTTVRLVARKPA